MWLREAVGERRNLAQRAHLLLRRDVEVGGSLAHLAEAHVAGHDDEREGSAAVHLGGGGLEPVQRMLCIGCGRAELPQRARADCVCETARECERARWAGEQLAPVSVRAGAQRLSTKSMLR